MNAAKKRLYVLFGIIVTVFVLLAIRLFYIQVVGLDDAKAAYSSQHTSGISGINFRGDILDRNGKLLVNRNDVYYILVDKLKFDDIAENYLYRLDSERINIQNRRYFGYKTEEYKKEMMDILREDYGAYVFMGTERYSSPQPAAHLIGYCSEWDNRGVFGIEGCYDSELSSDRSIRLMVDGVGRILPGHGIAYNETKRGESVKLTIDYDIQKITEAALAEVNPYEGAVVVVDVNTGEISASASYPFIDPENTQNAKGNDLINKALQSTYPPGSIFKIIVAAAALEMNAVRLDETFICSGSENLYGVEISCNKKEGHGEISFSDAFANSCNCAFIQLGKRIGSQAIIDMAHKFGLGKKVLGILPEEKQGNLPTEDQLSGAGIGNLSIGQGELEISCLQGAQIAGIIACGGKNPGMYLIDGQENSQMGKRVISTKAALGLKAIMEDVVRDGTGRRAGEDSSGKTGSAQAYRNGEKVTHGWYVGYFPRNNPEYAVSVFTGCSGGAGSAVSIFAKIHEEMTDMLR